MRIAILIVGHIRTWEKCKENFIEAFGHLNSDVFLTTYDLQYNYHPAQKLNWMVGQRDVFLEEEEIVNLFKDINLIDVDYEKVEDAKKDYNVVYDFLHPNFKGEEHTVLQSRKIIRGFDIIKKYEQKNNFTYDVIIKIRSDIHHNKFEYDISNKNIIISDKNVYPNDVLFACKRNNFEKITQFLINEFFNPRYEDSHLQAPHNLFLRAFEFSNLEIEQKDLMKYVVRISGNQVYN